MLLSRILAVSLLVLSPAAFADSLDVNLNNSAFQVQFNSSASDFIEGNSEIHGGVLYNDATNLFFDAGLLVKGGGEEGAPGLSVGIGVKGVFGTIHQPAAAGAVAPSPNTVSALGVGGQLVFALPTPTRVALVGEYYASPQIMSFADCNRYDQFVAMVQIEVSPQANVYMGYREIGFGIKGGSSVALDKSNMFGVIMSF